ncbi:MerR family transcriptional regulator [Amycolatopsis sp. NPDC051106]|jgi:MerR family transcriptional regulator, redox-sensitive transcriptional activator SoxR|uniref:MerR family transcriptional regulator n=1 Tax=unclassified Amycolatopsis TaxID=2618356 RepID=UPI0034293309
MRIGELAEKTGVSVRALRYYEEQGMLVPERSAGGHRHYSERGVEVVWLIQQFYAAGLSSKTILTILPCVESREATPEALAVLVAERDRIDRRLAELAGTRKQLDDVIAIASSGACSHDSRPD